MLVRELSKLANYLNSNGFAVTSNQILDFMSFTGEEDINIFNNDEFSQALSVYVSKNKEQQSILPSLIRNYVQKKHLITEKTEQLEKAKQAKENYKRPDNIEESVREQMSEKFKKELEQSKKAKSKLDDIEGISDKTKETPTPENIESEMQSVSQKAKEALSKGDVAEFNKMNDAYKALEKVKKLDDKISKSDKEREEAIKNAIAKEEEKEQKIDDKIKKVISELETIEKLESVSSKKDSKEKYGKPTKSYSEGEINNSLEINEYNILDIYKFIRENKEKFKTKFNRRVNTRERRKLAIKETIKSACRTGGKPLVLEFEKPKRSKANLVLVLDVSGSCSAASKALMALAHSFKEIFPGGTKVYAFVNSLYDVSKAMETINVEESIEKVFDAIPTSGVYSNYYNPLRSLWTSEQTHINKDSIVMFIGDARNNKNPSGEEYLKQIAKKSKKTVFLNTEDSWTWDTGDSIAGIYERIVPMYEVTNLAELEFFIENI